MNTAEHPKLSSHELCKSLLWDCKIEVAYELGYIDNYNYRAPTSWAHYALYLQHNTQSGDDSFLSISIFTDTVKSECQKSSQQSGNSSDWLHHITGCLPSETGISQAW